jgi:hypothetical protein
LYFYAFVSHVQDRHLAIMDRHLAIIQLINQSVGTMADTQGITVETTRKLAELLEKKT